MIRIYHIFLRFNIQLIYQTTRNDLKNFFKQNKILTWILIFYSNLFFSIFMKNFFFFEQLIVFCHKMEKNHSNELFKFHWKISVQKKNFFNDFNRKNIKSKTSNIILLTESFCLAINFLLEQLSDRFFLRIYIICPIEVFFQAEFSATPTKRIWKIQKKVRHRKTLQFVDMR